jgi:hypothetical protein
MRELLAAGIDLKLQAVVDGKKCYPRDFERPGRLRVQLKNRCALGKCFNKMQAHASRFVHCEESLSRPYPFMAVQHGRGYLLLFGSLQTEQGYMSLSHS